MVPPPSGYNVDFSLAIRNRTGKYIIGQELLKDQASLVRKTYYWRLPLANPPGKSLARILDLGTNIELRLRRGLGNAILPTLKRDGPTLHLDPYTVIMAELSPRDIALVHDVGPVTHPALFDQNVQSLYDNAFRRLTQADARLVFVSEASRDGFIAAYGRVSDMRVIYPPIRPSTAQKGGDPVEGIDGPFLLTVGSLGRRKNQRFCIEAFAKSGLAGQGYRYVLCGAREPGADEAEALARATPGVCLLPYVSDQQLAWLYANAQGFVLMSLLEGFGIPVAEAIFNGLVPLLSKGSVLEEVAGGQALVASPDDLTATISGMRALVEMTALERDQRRTSLQAHIASFSRARFSEQWAQVLAS